MPKCLNCGKEVKNKFCNVHCQNEYKGKLNRLQYEENPNKCACCGAELSWEKRKNKYCSSSCAAKINNTLVVKRKKQVKPTAKETLFDTISDSDFKEIVLSSTTLKEICNKIGYTAHASITQKIKSRCIELNIDIPGKVSMKKITKGELFAKRKNWQSARSSIRKDADNIFNNSTVDKKCYLCGYDKHIEIAHIKAVSEFSDDVLVSEINNIRNLIPLCPNHHWEFDNNRLSSEELKQIENYYNSH